MNRNSRTYNKRPNACIIWSYFTADLLYNRCWALCHARTCKNSNCNHDITWTTIVNQTLAISQTLKKGISRVTADLKNTARNANTIRLDPPETFWRNNPLELGEEGKRRKQMLRVTWNSKTTGLGLYFLHPTPSLCFLSVSYKEDFRRPKQPQHSSPLFSASLQLSNPAISPGLCF